MKHDPRMVKQIEEILRSRTRHTTCPFCDFKPPKYLHNQAMSVASHIRRQHQDKRPSKKQQILNLFDEWKDK